MINRFCLRFKRFRNKKTKTRKTTTWSENERTISWCFNFWEIFKIHSHIYLWEHGYWKFN